MSCIISEQLSECKRDQRVVGHFIPVPVSDGYTKVPRVPDISEKGCKLSECKMSGPVGNDGDQ